MLQIERKTTTNFVQMQHRKVISLNKKDIKSWETIFSMFGHKADCSRTIGVPANTITRILKNEKGLERIVVAIRQYVDNANK